MTMLDCEGGVADRSLSPATRAARLLRNSIRQGEWQPGERLPSESHLVSRLQVSRGTLRKALAQLEAEGLLRDVPGKGRKACGRVVVPDLRDGRPAGLMSKTVALLTHLSGPISTDPTAYHRGRYMAAVDAGVAAAVGAAGLHLLSINGEHLAQADAGMLVRDQPRGLIATQATADNPRVLPVLEAVLNGGVPVVTLGHESVLESFDRVISDHEGGSHELTRFLLARGCRRICVMGTFTGMADEPRAWMHLRERGYARAMRDAGLAALPPVYIKGVLPPDGTAERFFYRVRQVAGFVAAALGGAEPVDGILALTDFDASLIAAACRMLGKTPNRDVAIVGYDDVWDNEERAWEPARPLATMDKRNAELGKVAVELLNDRFEGRVRGRAVVRVLPPRLVVPDADAPARQS